MYDNLQKNYRVIFEGRPSPIFYKYFYPTGNNHDALWDLFGYARGLKKDNERDDEHYERFSRFRADGDNARETVNVYERDLRDLLNAVYTDTRGLRNTGIVAIPSSNAGKVNRVTELIRTVLKCTPGAYKDLTYNVHRRMSKDTAHGSGIRSIESNVSTLDANRRNEILGLELIIVIDDIVTSGNSFRAMEEFLRGIGYRGQIVNFAFARHYSSEVVEAYLEHDHGIEYEYIPETRNFRSNYTTSSRYSNKNEHIFGIVYDLDQTLIDDSIRKIRFEESLWKGASAFPYEFYDGIKELMELPLPSVIVSNRPYKELKSLFGSFELRRSIPIPASSVFSFPKEERGPFTTRYYKPHPDGVDQALSHLRQKHNLSGCRIVGVGNTKEDIIAYKTCGIEAILALWGVPNWLKETARYSWQADFVFESVDELRRWLEANMEKPDYYEMGKQAESRDEDQACAYYAKALKYGTNVCGAAFRYARLIDDRDPKKAKELYQISIEEGDEYAATNNLALLIEDEHPEQAIALFERAIAAGSKDKATRNLAMLIKEDDPERAIQLLRQAAEAGNDRSLAEDLKPFIRAGSESAVQLYRDAIVVKDSKKANDLGCLLFEIMPERAKELFELAIEYGDDRIATFNLAAMIGEADKARSSKLYEMSIAAGDKKNSPNNLANLIKEEDPDRAASLFEMAVQGGNDYYAARNLADLIKQRDPKRAVELFAQAAKAGNKDNLYVDLEPLMREGYEAAIDLCEKEVVSQNAARANDLGVLIKAKFPVRAKRLFEIGFAAGDIRYAASNLAKMIETKDPRRAEDLYRKSITAGNDNYAKRHLAWLIWKTKPEEAEELLRQVVEAYSDIGDINALGVMVAYRDLEEGKRILRQGMDAGDTWCAPVNLAHLMLAHDIDLAKRFYETALEFDEPEAWCGLSYILRNDDSSKASEYLEMLRDVANIDASMEFFLDFVALADKKTAIDAGIYFAEKGFSAARRNVLKLSFGNRYKPKSDTLEYGRVFSGEGDMQWHVLQILENRVLLLSKNAVHCMPYVEGASSADWDNSAVRQWLNGEFVEAAFGNLEDSQSRILRISGDLVSCLTPEEYESLANGSTSTNHIYANSVTQLQTTWWLKAAENSTMSAPYVKENGSIGWAFSLLKNGVRPALWLTLEDDA